MLDEAGAFMLLLACIVYDFNSTKGGYMLALVLSSSEQRFLHTIALMKRASRL